MTLTEVVVALGLVAMVCVVLAAAVAVVLRSEGGVRDQVAEAHDLQQVVNYFYTDVQSGPFAPAAYRGTDDADRGTGCADTGGENVFRFDDGDRRIAYRLTQTQDTASLDRYVCEWSGADWTVEAVVNITDSLDGTSAASTTSGSPVSFEVIDDDLDNEVDRVVLTLGPADDFDAVAATPRAETGLSVGLPYVADCPNDPIAATLGFGAFIEGDVDLHDGNLKGTLAVGGLLSWDLDFNLSESETNPHYAGLGLYAAGIDWISPSEDQLTSKGGDIALGGTYYATSERVYESSARSSNYISVEGAVRSLTDVGVIDFAAQFESLRNCSLALGLLPTSCTISGCAQSATPKSGTSCGSSSPAYSGSGPFCILLGSSGAQVLTIPASELDEATDFGHGGTMSSTRPLIINIIDDDGDGAIDFRTGSTRFESVGNTRNVLFNFPNATSVILDDMLYGTVLAPDAHVTTTQDSQGGIIAARWTHQTGEVRNRAPNLFQGDIQW